MPSAPYAVTFDGRPVEFYTHGDVAYNTAKRLAAANPGVRVAAGPEWTLPPEQRIHERMAKKWHEVHIETLDLFTQEWRPI